VHLNLHHDWHATSNNSLRIDTLDSHSNIRSYEIGQVEIEIGQ